MWNGASAEKEPELTWMSYVCRIRGSIPFQKASDTFQLASLFIRLSLTLHGQPELALG